MTDTGKRWQKIRQIFDDAMEQPAHERQNFLQQQCADDAELLQQILTLIRHSDVSDEEFGNIVREAAADVTQADDEPGVDQRVGSYRLIDLVGTGGMGNVYLAERADDQFEQRVAIKLLHPGRRDNDLLARFRAERQMLAILEHPNIARLLDGGETENGIPYLVMEYIDGLPVDQYCDKQRLSISERLRLFQKICAAVDYAHRNLVVHRDIKPSNILVTADGEPKLLDFGIAKLLDKNPANYAATVTRYGASILTPEYASPEQVRAERVSTATDIYSLGVLLYKILCGRMPYRTKALNNDLARAILKELPSRPSVALTSPTQKDTDADTSQVISTARSSSINRLKRRLQGDLDNVVLMALRKEPEHRYKSANAFSIDIENFLSYRPVNARPASISYRSAKFLRRYRTGTAVTVMVAVLLVASIMQIVHQRNKAQTAAVQSEQVVNFLGDLFVSASPLRAQGEEITAKDLLEVGVVEIGKLDDQPEVQARLLEIMGESYLYIGEFPIADNVIGRALEIRETRLPYDAHAIGENLRQYSEVRRLTGDLDGAGLMLRRSLDLLVEAHGEQHRLPAYVMARIGEVLRMRSRTTEAVEILERAVAIKEELGETDDLDAIDMYGNLAIALDDAGRLAEAEAINRKVVAASRKTLGDKGPNTLIRIGNLGLIQTRQGNYAEALLSIDEAYDSINQIWQSNPGRLIWAASIKAYTYSYVGRFDQALELREEQRRLAVEHYGSDSPRYSKALQKLAEWHLFKNHPEEAMALLQQAIEIEARGDRDAGFRAGIIRLQMTMAGIIEGNYSVAEAMARQALSQPDKLGHTTTMSLPRELARTLSLQDRFDEATLLFEESLSGRESFSGPNSVSLLPTLIAMSKHFRRAGQFDRALLYSRRAHNIGLSVTPPGTWQPAFASAEHALVLLTTDNNTGAETIFDTAIADLTTTFGKTDSRIVTLQQQYQTLTQ